MKVSKENYSRIKQVMEIWLQTNTKGINIHNFHISTFFLLHYNTYACYKNNSIDLHSELGFLFAPDGQFRFGDYQYYPDNCNDSHLETVFKCLKKDIKDYS